MQLQNKYGCGVNAEFVETHMGVWDASFPLSQIEIRPGDSEIEKSGKIGKLRKKCMKMSE